MNKRFLNDLFACTPLAKLIQFFSNNKFYKSKRAAPLHKPRQKPITISKRYSHGHSHRD